MKALAIAATGMSAQQLNVQVIANNIANINTTAFKRSRAEFTDLTYQVERLQGVPNRGRDNPVPEGSRLGLGVRSAAIRNLHLQGTMANTGPRGEKIERRNFPSASGGISVRMRTFQIEKEAPSSIGEVSTPPVAIESQSPSAETERELARSTIVAFWQTTNAASLWHCCHK